MPYVTRLVRLILPVLALFMLCWTSGPDELSAQDEVASQELVSFGGHVRATTTDASRLFVAKGQRLIIYDLSGDPIFGDEPIELTQTSVGDMIESIAYADNRVYLGLKHGDIVVVDVSDEQAPVVRGRVTVRVNDEENKEVEGVAILGSHLYCNLGKDGLRVVDVADPMNPQPGANVSAAQEWINGLVVANGRLYTLERVRDTSPTRMVVRVYSTVNPAAPSVEGFAEIDRNVGGLHLAVEGTHAYVFGNFWNNGIAIVDVATPTNPQLLATFEDGGNPTPVTSVTAVDNRLYAQRSPFSDADQARNLMTIDLTNPAQPQKIDEITLTGFQSNFTGALPVHENRIIMTYGVGDVAMEMIDLADADKPTSIRTFGEPTTYYAQVVIGSTLYRSTQQTVEAWDITDPNTPVQKNVWSGDDYADILAIAGDEDRLLLSKRGTGPIDGTITIVEIDGTDATVRGSYTTVDHNHKAVLKGDHLYIISIDGDPWSDETGPWGLDIVSIANPGSPNRVARIEGSLRDIIADDTRDVIYLLADIMASPHSARTGLVALDVTNPASPSIASNATTAGTRGRMAMANGHIVAVSNAGSVFGGNGIWSLEVFDISNPNSIARTGGFTGPSGTMELASDVTASPSGIVTVGLMGVGYRFFELDAIAGTSDEKSRNTAEDPKPSGSVASAGVSSFANFSTEKADYVVAKDYTWATVYSYPDNRKYDHRSDGGATYLCYKKVDPNTVRLTTFVWPVKAIKEGCRVMPPGTTEYPRNALASVEAKEGPQWRFERWAGDLAGDANPATLQMSSDKQVIGAFTSGTPHPTLTVGLQSNAALCFPPGPEKKHRIKVGTVTASPDPITDWFLKELTIPSVKDFDFVSGVIVIVDGKEFRTPEIFNFDSTQPRPSISIFHQVASGETAELEIYFEFDYSSKFVDTNFIPCPLGKVYEYAIELSSAELFAEPDEPRAFPEWTVLPSPTVVFRSETKTVACVIDEGGKKGYDKIQPALSASPGGTMLTAFNGRYTGPITIDKQIALSAHAPDRPELTEIRSDASTVVQMSGEESRLRGFRIVGGGRGSGVVANGDKVEISACHVDNVEIGVDFRSSKESVVQDASITAKLVAIVLGKKIAVRGNRLRSTGDRRRSKGISNEVDGRFTLDSNIIEKNDILGFGQGVALDFSLRTRILNNEIRGCRTGVAILTTSRKCRVEGNTISSNETGINVVNASGTRVVRNVISDSRSLDQSELDYIGVGIDLHKVTDTDVLANRILSNNNAMEVSSSNGVRIIRNRLVGNRSNIGTIDSDIRIAQNYFASRDEPDRAEEKDEKGRRISSIEAGTGISIEGGAARLKGNTILDGTIGLAASSGATVMMRRNDIEGSGDVGVQNSDPTMILDARSNWWGDLSGPSGEGPGSGDAVSRYVDFADWRIMPFDVVVTAAIDTLWVRPGDTDSLAVYFRDGLRSDGVLAIDASDDRGWVVGTGRAEVDLVDSLGGETTYAYTIPQDVGAGTFDYFRFTATSTEDDAQTDSDSLVIATYAPVLTRLIIGPDTLKVLPGDTADFVAIGFDQHGRLVETGATIWNATGGIIDNEGLFIAGGAHGTYLVTGRDDASGVEGATVVIVTDDISSVAAPVAGDAPIDLSVVATPNPVRERTTIRFTVDDLDIDGTQHTPVSLRIVDPLGRVVATLVDHTLTSGSYSVAWEVGEALPSGLYHVDLQTGDRRAAGSLILTR